MPLRRYVAAVYEADGGPFVHRSDAASYNDSCILDPHADATTAAPRPNPPDPASWADPPASRANAAAWPHAATRARAGEAGRQGQRAESEAARTRVARARAARDPAPAPGVGGDRRRVHQRRSDLPGLLTAGCGDRSPRGDGGNDPLGRRAEQPRGHREHVHDLDDG